MTLAETANPTSPRRCSTSTGSASRSTATRRCAACRWCCAGRDARDHRPQRRRQDDDDGRHHRQDAARRGRRHFDGRHDLTKLDEAEIATLGVGRKFQKPTVFENHTVDDNILLAAKAPRAVSAPPCSAREDPKTRERSTRILATTRLADHRARLAGSLSHGQKQWLEIGMLLAQDPKLLLVDEPVAGMTDGETAATADLLREIARDHSVVVVEHDMAFRARARRQGDVPARRLRARRRLARSGQRRPARH